MSGTSEQHKTNIQTPSFQHLVECNPRSAQQYLLADLQHSARTFRRVDGRVNVIRKQRIRILTRGNDVSYWVNEETMIYRNANIDARLY
jgi:hypothetical protein